MISKKAPDEIPVQVFVDAKNNLPKSNFYFKFSDVYLFKFKGEQ